MNTTNKNRELSVAEVKLMKEIAEIIESKKQTFVVVMKGI